MGNWRGRRQDICRSNVLALHPRQHAEVVEVVLVLRGCPRVIAEPGGGIGRRSPANQYRNCCEGRP